MKRLLLSVVLFLGISIGASAQERIGLVCATPEHAVAYLTKHEMEQVQGGHDVHDDKWTLHVNAKGDWILLYWRDDGLACAAVEGTQWKTLPNIILPTK